MLVYLVDDRGPRGEYASFINAYAQALPPMVLAVYTHWAALFEAIEAERPACLLADMRFDETPTKELYGDIVALANTEQFCGNLERAEAQIRGMQGLLIIRALRERGIDVPVILFAPFPEDVRTRILTQLAPIQIIDGLVFREVQTALKLALGTGRNQ
ncbi:MAG: hypothetical protein FWC40_01895 [Proteobacteria bacterium]|nr:hypothetical protein [Pseudomonadota bacterium]